MIEARIDPTLESWRESARRLLAAHVPPDQVLWIEKGQTTLLPTSPLPAPLANSPQKRVPAAFLDLCIFAACHRDGDRWSFLYRVLWRITHEQPKLLELSIDDDTRRLNSMAESVKRDRHKMTAFVRFRKVIQDDQEFFIAWYQPDHFIVRLTAPFFKERFPAMHWTILTPDESVSWDTRELHFGPGVPRSVAPQSDALEDLWKTYYASTFNPNRLSVGTMKHHLSVRHWKTLPETEMLPSLIRSATPRANQMLLDADAATQNATSAADFIPNSPYTLPQLKEAARGCRGCELCERATQTVFGEGPADARIVMVGEQPGDQEDLAGRPFVGPAGQLLDEILREVDLPREQVYITNAVKHFKWEPRGKRRMHSTPNARDMAACLPWIEAELKVIKPPMLVCLGSTAAKSLLGAGFRITQQRGVVFKTKWAPWTLATYHPSALLRIPDPESAAAARRQFTADLLLVKEQLAQVAARN